MRGLIETLHQLWIDLELRLLLLLSLSLQIVLIAIGNRRKHERRRWVSVIVWIFYLSADSVATLALGVLSRTKGDAKDPSYTIMALWAPFLLLHLGGPDTITAYSLADNELWSRHFLGLLVQVGFAILVVVRPWSVKPVNFVSIPIGVAGLIKYGERTWVLFSASRDRYRDSIVSSPDPGPNYAKFMDEFVSKESEGYVVSLKRVIDENIAMNNTRNGNVGEGIEDGMMLRKAYFFFGTFKELFADLILSFQDKETSQSFFKEQTWDKAFDIVEVELGLMFDLFYTKSLILYSRVGLFLRGISFSSSVAALIVFVIIDKRPYPRIEVIVTYILMIGAISLEMYSILLILSSDRVTIWLSDRPKSMQFRDTIVDVLHKLRILPSTKRWSNAMGKYNVFDCCLKSKLNPTKIDQYLEKLFFYVEKYLFWSSVSVPSGLKALIFDELKLRSNSSELLNRKLGDYRGDKILLKERDCFDKSDNVEFDQSVLLWHMATDLCYHADANEEEVVDRTWLYQFIVNEESSLQDNLKFKREMSRWLSDYMIYLLIMSPFMLPSGIGQIRFQDTCAEAVVFFEGQKLSKREACSKLRLVDVRIPPSEVKGDRSKSLLFDACRLVQSLQSLEDREKWEKITQAWLDILTFAAAQCRGNDHAEKLGQGGELLTHVWLLMAHFGMTDQFQISQGYVRAKLLAK